MEDNKNLNIDIKSNDIKPNGNDTVNNVGMVKVNQNNDSSNKDFSNKNFGNDDLNPDDQNLDKQDIDQLSGQNLNDDDLIDDNNQSEIDINMEDMIINRDMDMEKILLDSGLNNTQIQKIYELANEKFGDILTTNNNLKQENMNRELEVYFGGKQEWENLRDTISKWSTANLPNETVNHLGSSVDGVISLYQMMKFNQEPALGNNSSNQNVLNQDTLRDMMDDPRYWRDKDETYIREVQKGFRTVYGDEKIKI